MTSISVKSTLNEDHSFWEELETFRKYDYSKYIDDREDQDEIEVRIAEIGKTCVINAIRAIKISS
jgi:hypothetical protein